MYEILGGVLSVLRRSMVNRTKFDLQSVEVAKFEKLLHYIFG
jgi:hypothetical protein